MTRSGYWLRPLVLVLLSSFLNAAEITRVNPGVIPPEGGTLVNLYGDGFVRGDIARINGVAMTRVAVTDAKRMSGRSPALPPGVYIVDVVAARGGVKARLVNAITVKAPDVLEATLARLSNASRSPLESMFRHGVPCFITGKIPGERRGHARENSRLLEALWQPLRPGARRRGAQLLPRPVRRPRLDAFQTVVHGHSRPRRQPSDRAEGRGSGVHDRQSAASLSTAQYRSTHHGSQGGGDRAQGAREAEVAAGRRPSADVL